MKKALGFVLAIAFASPMAGCMYGGVGTTADGSKAIISRNDAFLYGALRKVFVCKVADGGVSACAESESP